MTVILGHRDPAGAATAAARPGQAEDHDGLRGVAQTSLLVLAGAPLNVCHATLGATVPTGWQAAPLAARTRGRQQDHRFRDGSMYRTTMGPPED